MARPIRKKISFDEESVNRLFQEVYDDTHIIRAKITRLMTKWEIKIKENGEIAALGDTIVKLIGAEAKNQDQKIMLLKYLKEVVFDKKGSSDNSNNDNDENKNISDDRRNELIDMVQNQIEQNEKKQKNR
jgi:hypothetical protein